LYIIDTERESQAEQVPHLYRSEQRPQTESQIRNRPHYDEPHEQASAMTEANVCVYLLFQGLEFQSVYLRRSDFIPGTRTEIKEV